MKSYRDFDLKFSVILLVFGGLMLLIATLISYFTTGKFDQNVGNSWCLLPVGIISITAGLMKLTGALTGTSDEIGRSTSYSCPYCKKAISTKDIPLEGHWLYCPHCKKLIVK